MVVVGGSAFTIQPIHITPSCYLSQTLFSIACVSQANLAERAALIIATEDVDSTYGGPQQQQHKQQQQGASGGAALLERVTGEVVSEGDVLGALENLDAEGILKTLKSSDLKGLRVSGGGSERDAG